MIQSSSTASTLAVAIAGVVSTLVCVNGAVAQTAVPQLPVAIMCFAASDQSWRLGYLDRVGKDGEALYTSANGRLSVRIDAKGVVATPTNRAAGLDCFGKSLEELRAQGRTLEFQRAK